VPIPTPDEGCLPSPFQCSALIPVSDRLRIPAARDDLTEPDSDSDGSLNDEEADVDDHGHSAVVRHPAHAHTHAVDVAHLQSVWISRLLDGLGSTEA
jgi:hypothetical protein